jgi:hypothetical protein
MKNTAKITPFLKGYLSTVGCQRNRPSKAAHIEIFMRNSYKKLQKRTDNRDLQSRKKGHEIAAACDIEQKLYRCAMDGGMLELDVLS